jgi:hypothetical protein
MWKIINFIVRFFTDVWHAGYFAIIEYDVKLQETKTLQQRILIWFAVILIALCIVFSILYSFWHFLDSIEVKGF